MSYTYGIVGNPNSGKTSLFNNLTGLNQKVGNYPGVTVERKVGNMKLGSESVKVVDLPGAYSVYARSEDEAVCMRLLTDTSDADYPDRLIVVIDATHLSRNLLFFSQVRDLGFSCVIALTMVDIAQKNGTIIDVDELQRQLQVPVVVTNPRRNKDTKYLKSALQSPDNYIENPNQNTDYQLGAKWSSKYGLRTPYASLVYACNRDMGINFLSPSLEEKFKTEIRKSDFRKGRFQAEDTYMRYLDLRAKISPALAEKKPSEEKQQTDRIDEILLHKVWGKLILFGVLFFVFQTIYKVAEGPMILIEELFGTAAHYMQEVLPDGWLTDLWISGIWSGLAGVAIFIPQIALLFALINILEDSGYMARISFLSDRMLSKVGLSGRSTMPLISSFACAVPSIMATRTIPNKYERLMAIMAIPLLSCSARLPVYVIMIGLVIPDRDLLGFIDLQGLVLLLLYLIGTIFSLLTAFVMSRFKPRGQQSQFYLELPHYRLPRLKNVLLSAYAKTRIFVVDAGRIILLISVVLWALASYAPGDRMQNIDQQYAQEYQRSLSELPESAQVKLASEKLEASYAGIVGKAIEPVIRPLGFDWKIGIALFTSFAAREVFVSTMSTIYALGDDVTDMRLIDKMKAAKNSKGEKIFTLGTSLALLVFYILAMQCMSTLVIIKRELGSWSVPVLVFFYMTALAYFMALLTQWLF